MKRTCFLTVVFLLITSHAVWGQTGGWTEDVGNNTVYLTNPNNSVGIGTLNPNRLLHLSSTSPEIKIENTQSGKSWQLINGGSYPDVFRISATGSGDYFSINHTTGDVGIGTATPNRLLHLRSASPVIRLENSQSGNDWQLINGGSYPDVFRISATGSDDHFSINHATGDVGIGTATPNRLLHLRSASPVIRLENSQSGNDWQLINGGDYPNVFRITATGKGDHFVINYATGNVGVGTLNPTEKLSVNGTIKAKKVVVSTSGWSDMVFQKGYTLMPLREVEQSIQQHKHLPGIPSEQEVLENGVDVGDLQAKLLQKIEELTLYMIEQDKQMAMQSQLLSELQHENELLKQRLSVLEQ